MGRLTDDVSEKLPESLDIMIEDFKSYIDAIEDNIKELKRLKIQLEARLIKLKIIKEARLEFSKGSDTSVR